MDKSLVDLSKYRLSQAKQCIKSAKLLAENDLEKFLGESEESINKYRKMYSFVLRNPDERVVMDNLVELAVNAYEGKVEEVEEQNYNMIDNVLNNDAEKAKKEADKKKWINLVAGYGSCGLYPVFCVNKDNFCNKGNLYSLVNMNYLY